MAKKKEDTLTYESAIEALEEIQMALESNEIPIDQLSEKVKKAHELVQFCRERLRTAESELEKLVQ